MPKPRPYPNRKARRKAGLYMLAYGASDSRTSHRTGLKLTTVVNIRLGVMRLFNWSWSAVRQYGADT